MKLQAKTVMFMMRKILMSEKKTLNKFIKAKKSNTASLCLEQIYLNCKASAFFRKVICRRTKKDVVANMR